MNLNGIDLIAIAGMVLSGFAVCYALIWWKLRVALTDRQLRLADQMGRLDDAIRALETRLTEHQTQAAAREQLGSIADLGSLKQGEEVEVDELSHEASEIAPEVQAAIAAAAVATAGPNAVVSSVKAVPSPWTQQGRVLVQGGHNLRVQR